MVSISTISTISSISSSRTTMPSQLQQHHHDNRVRDDTVVTNSIMENTINNVKNSHNRQIPYDPQNQQPFNESYSKRKFEVEDLMIVEVDNKKNNDIVKINNKSNENNNRNDDNEGNIIKYKSKSNTIDNNHLLNHPSSKILSSLPRRKSSVLDISSLLCELPSTSTNLSVYDSPSSVDEDSSMDDVSSHLGDTESLGSPRSFHKNSSTPATTPPYSPSGGTTTTTANPIITIDQEKRLFNNCNDDATYSQHDLQIQQQKHYYNNHNSNSNKSNNHYSQQQLSHHHQYMEQERSQEETIWKKPRLVLPPIRSFAPVPNLRSDSNNHNDFIDNNENSNGPYFNNQSSSPDHGKINSPVDHHSPQKSWNHLEQFAAITEAYRTNSSNISHADVMDNVSSSAIRLPPASSLTSHNHNNRSFENDHRNLQIQNAVTSNTLRRSSFDVTQTRFNPYTPSSSTLNPYAPPRFDTAMSNSPRNDHISLESSYLHHGYDRSDVNNRHYVQQRHSYCGMHSPQSPNTYYPMPSHSSYPTPPSNHHHLQLSHHHHHHLGSPYMDPSNSGTMVKAKRKRANANQLKVLNQVFQHTFFPSTELRIQLGKQLGMSPRTVQIWFQNKRQSWRSKSRATTNSPIKDDDGDENLDTEGNVENNNDGSVNENLVSRRASNSSLSCSDDDEAGRRSIPDSPLDNSFSRSDYFTSGTTRSQMNNSGSNNENVKMTSNAVSAQNSYFAQPQNNNNNGDYYQHHRSNSSGGVLTPTSPLPPASSLTNQLPSQLPSPGYSTSSNNERLPTFASSFAHTSSYHNTASTTSNVSSSNNYDPFPSNRLPMINHRSPQAQPSYGYQSAVSSGI